MPTFQVIDTGSGQDTFYQGMVKDAANWAVLEALAPVGTTATQTLTNKTLTTPTLTTPTIASFVNAAHTHASAAQGGILSVFNVVAATRALDAATGDVSYAHGLGVTPKAVIALGNKDGGAATRFASVGFASSASAMGTIGMAEVGYAQAKLLYSSEDTGKSQAAVFKSADATNCTLTWTRTGATAAGTFTFYLLFAG